MRSCRKCVGKTTGLSNSGKPGPNAGKQFSDETKMKMALAKQGSTPWNKGLKGVSNETKQKMSLKKKGKVANNRGVAMTEKQRIKLSCINQGIEVDDFTEFKTPKNKIERAKFYELGLHTQCFKNANFTCDKCNIRGTTLHAHHKNSWSFFKEERYEISNLVCLCDGCHKEFHSVFGNGKASPNTKLQYDIFKNSSTLKKELTIVTGAPASGKSWVASKIVNFNVIDSDIVSKRELVALCEQAVKPLLTLTIGVSTFIKNNPQFNVKLVVIVENEDVVSHRMLLRGGKLTNTIQRRIKRMCSLAKRAVFSGTSEEVLEYLNCIP